MERNAKMTLDPKPEILIKFAGAGRPMDISSDVWRRADAATVDAYWSGETAPAERQFTAKLLCNETALFALFEANQAGPLIVSGSPDLNQKTLGLWDRDVVEIFVAPDAAEPRRYFEFEAAPTGEWLDVAIDATRGMRETDWDYRSGMRAAADVRETSIVTLIEIPWTAFGRTPKAGDVWLGNLLRCVGTDPGRGYLAWSPTMTAEPNFHVPGKFGKFIFQD